MILKVKGRLKLVNHSELWNGVYLGYGYIVFVRGGWLPRSLRYPVVLPEAGGLIITPHILLTLQVYEVLKTLHVTIITSEWDTALATFTITILLNAHLFTTRTNLHLMATSHEPGQPVSLLSLSTCYARTME